MKLLVDEMPLMSIDDKAECQCLKEFELFKFEPFKFEPFKFEPEFKAVFTKDHKLVKEANDGKA